MPNLTINTFLSLDGVVQAPGGPTEDPSGGFTLGGWSAPYGDEDFGSEMVEWINGAGGFVLGRNTYEIFASHWPKVGDDDPIAKQLNSLPKYVASTTLDSLEWNGAELLDGDVVEAVRRLKAGDGAELQIHGSGTLAQTLMRAGLIDRYRLWYFPVVLGHGKRLFPDDAPQALRLEKSLVTSTGVVLHSYVPDGPVPIGSYQLDE